MTTTLKVYGWLAFGIIGILLLAPDFGVKEEVVFIEYALPALIALFICSLIEILRVVIKYLVSNTKP